MLINYCSFCLCGKLLIFPSILSDNFPGSIGLVVSFFTFSIWNISCHSILADMGFPCMQLLFLLLLLRVSILSLTHDILTIMCLGVDLFGLILFGTLFDSWTWMSISLTKLGNFSVTSSSKSFSISSTLFSFRDPLMKMLLCLKLSKGPVKYPHIFFFLIFPSGDFHYPVFHINDPVFGIVYSAVYSL